MSHTTRRTALGLIGLGAVLNTGCMTRPLLSSASSDGTYCFTVGSTGRRTRTCTPAQIPSQAVEADAKRFEPAAELLTVYVERHRWNDARNQIWLAMDGGTAVATVPQSFVRLRVRPGMHKLTATWSKGTTSLEITGFAGEVKFVELVGPVWVWGSTYRLEPGDPADSRGHASKLRLVADVG
jgi:hypothetical protein